MDASTPVVIGEGQMRLEVEGGAMPAVQIQTCKAGICGTS